MAFSEEGLLKVPPVGDDHVALVAEPPIVPESGTVAPAQIVIGAPASTEADWNLVIVTSLKVPAHVPSISVMVQRNTWTPSGMLPMTVVGELGFCIAIVPCGVTIDHVPISPTPGLLAAMVVLSVQIF
jgi:hypothetical protein